MKKISVMFLWLAAGCTGMDAQGFVTSRGVRVNPVNETVFEVAPGIGAPESQYWCGAGDYAWRELGVGGNGRVYVVSGVGPGLTIDRKDTAQFSLQPPAPGNGAAARRSSWGPQIGESMAVTTARSRCHSRPEDRF